jgi:UDP-glucose 4-epimerase
MSGTLNVLVAGGAGYIGTHMVNALLNAGHNSITLDNLSTGHRELLPGGEFIRGDIADTALVDQVFKTHAIDAVMHFAAFIEVGESVQDPLKYYANNVSATTNLLNCMLQNNVNRFIFSSTAAVYGEPLYTPIDEDHPLAPANAYGRTKQYVETMLADCAAAHDLQYVSLRYFNAAGADPSAAIGERHQPGSHLIPLVLDAAMGKRDHIELFGADYDTPDGTCIRDYIHVNDLVNAHLLSLSRLMNGGCCQVYNLGNSIGHSVRHVIDIAEKVTGKKVTVKVTDRRAGDPAELIAGSEKIKTELGWIPQYEDLQAIIQTAWDWHLRI